MNYFICFLKKNHLKFKCFFCSLIKLFLRSEEQKFREAMEKQKKLEELQNQPFAMRGLLQEQERINRAQQGLFFFFCFF